MPEAKRRKAVPYTRISRPRQRRSVSRLGRGRHALLYEAWPFFDNLRGGLARQAVRPRLSVTAQRILAVIGVMVSGGLLAMLLTAPSFRVTRFEVTGNQGVTAREVQAALSRLAGESVILINTAAAAQLVERVPGVRQATVSCWLPNRCRVTVSDVRPTVIWAIGGQNFGVSDDGVLIPLGETGERLLTIREAMPRPPQVGEMVDTSALHLARRLDLLLGHEVTAYEHSRKGEIVAIMAQGWRAVFSSASDADEQVRILELIAKELRNRGEGFRLIDVRVPERVVYQ